MNNTETNDPLPPERNGENHSSTQTAISPEFEPAYSAVVEAAVKSILAKQNAQAGCCPASTSYIHVYQHSAQCTASGHAHSNDAGCAPQPEQIVSDPQAAADSRGAEIGFPSFATLFSSARSLLKRVPLGRSGTEETGKNGTGSRKTAPTDYQEDSEQDAELVDNDTRDSSSPDDEDSDESQLHDPEWDAMFPPPPPQRKVWHRLDGIAAMFFGVAAPLLISLMTIASCPKRITLVILNHPVETLVELALLLLIPVMNYKVWSSICKNDVRFSLRRGVALGASIATSIVIAGISFAAIPAGYSEMAAQVGTDFSVGFFFIGLLGLSSALT
ncbi:MAG: hypothetical protein K2Z81_18280, partial [Cyanobacteria bacterium]|nr:hypothetical protein [Cyanobacteriota bacterium]